MSSSAPETQGSDLYLTEGSGRPQTDHTEPETEKAEEHRGS